VTFKRAIKRIFLFLLFSFIVVIGSSIFIAYYYQDEIKNHFINEMNKQLNTPVRVEQVNVSALDDFPNISLSFTNVYIEESFKNSSDPLVTADKIQFSFNLLEIYKGNYELQKIKLSGGKAFLKVSKNGITNYEIFKPSNEKSEKGKVILDLSKIILQNTHFIYQSDKSNIVFECTTKQTQATVNIRDKQYFIKSNGEVELVELMVNDKVFAEGKTLGINSELVFDDEQKHLDFKNSKLKINGSDFTTYGEYEFGDTQYIDFYIETTETNLESVLGILPERVSKKLKKYKSSGGLSFDLNLKGKFENQVLPALNINFGLLDSNVTYPENNISIKGAFAEGKFTVPNLSNPNKGEIEFYNIKGILADKPFQGSLRLNDFGNPHLEMEFDGLFDAASLIGFLGLKDFEDISGELKADFEMKGKINDLKKKETAANVKTSGEIDLKNIAFQHKAIYYPLKKLNGNLLFNTNDVAISGISGLYGSSDFLVNGFFKNIIAYVLFDNEPIGIEADLKSKFINLDELLKSEDNATDYNFKLNPNLLLKFNCNVDQLSFRRFKPSNIKGDLQIKNEIAYTRKLEFYASGGSASLSGVADASKADAIDIESVFNIDNLNIDSVFYVFENFNQNFLVDKNLKGKIKASVETSLKLTPGLRLLPESLSATISTSILGGELNDFEPMQKLSKYVEEEKLDHLTFSELRNEIFIENKTIYLPQMEVSSNVSTIKIAGTHTFNQQIDYSVVAPLRNRDKIDPDEAFGAIEEDVKGQSKLFLKIIGSTSDYKIIYDKKRVKEKIVKDLQKEFDELKNAFKNKGLDKKKTVELEEDDYFDWDNDNKR